MVFSELLANYMQTYALTPQAAAVGVLVSRGGFTRADACCLLFPQHCATIDSANKFFQNLCKQQPRLKEFINTLSIHTDGRKVNDNAKQYRTKEEVLRGLECTLPELSGRERAAVLCQIADLQRFKQADNEFTPQLVHYYLPCKRFLT